MSRDIILEIAVIITDGDLTVLDPGLVRIIHRSQEELSVMGEWCVDQHGKVRIMWPQLILERIDGTGIVVREYDRGS